MPRFPTGARRFQAALIVGLLGCLIASSCPALVGPAREDAAASGHVVMVLVRNAGKAGFCSGVVLAPDLILTAGHCARPAGDMRVFTRDAGGAPVFLAVRAVSIHPGFRADAIARRVASVDLALIELASRLDGRFSAPGLDETGDVATGQRLVVAGFGVAREGEQSSAGVLRSIDLAVRAPLSKVLVWAEDPGGSGGGACVGDSGGPIFSGEDLKLLAITAWSEGRGGERHCGSLTQGVLVAPARGWIEKTKAQWSNRP